MQIQIASQLAPYSHRPGAACLLPGAPYALEVFPAFFRIWSYDIHPPAVVAEIELALERPLEQFTVQQDIKNKLIKVWGIAADGPLRLTFKVHENEAIVAVIEKQPQKGLVWRCRPCTQAALQRLDSLNNEEFVSDTLYKGESICIKLPEKCQRYSAPEKGSLLSLGNHKAQEWENICKRKDPKEFIPFWHGLGQLYPFAKKIETLPTEGTAELLHRADSAIKEKKGEEALNYLAKFFTAGFSSWLLPRFNDESFQGIVSTPFKPEEQQTLSPPLALLGAGALLINKLFIAEEDDKIIFFPALPSSFHCGRLIHVRYGTKALINVEWTKGMLRRVVVSSFAAEKLHLAFPASLRRFRLRTDLKEKGTFLSSACIDMENGKQYLFDNFQK